jgi:hypothetical protein
MVFGHLSTHVTYCFMCTQPFWDYFDFFCTVGLFAYSFSQEYVFLRISWPFGGGFDPKKRPDLQGSWDSLVGPKNYINQLFELEG